MVLAAFQAAPHLEKGRTLSCLSSLASFQSHIQQDQEVVKELFTIFEVTAGLNSKNCLYYSIKLLILKRMERTRGFYNTLVFLILLLAGNGVSAYANVYVDLFF